MSRAKTMKRAILLLAGLLACRGAESDEVRIRRVFFDAAKAAEDKRISDAVKDVSERFQSDDLDRDGVKSLVAAAVLRGGWVSATVAASAVRVEGDRATAVVDVILARGPGRPSMASLAPDEGSVQRFELSLSREHEGWKIVSGHFRSVNLAEALAGPPDPPSLP